MTKSGSTGLKPLKKSEDIFSLLKAEKPVDADSAAKSEPAAKDSPDTKTEPPAKNEDASKGEIILARLVKVLYYSEKNAFCIGIFRPGKGKKTFTAKGRLPDPVPGFQYELTGSFVEDPRYGKQFDFNAFEFVYEDDPDYAVHFLSSKTFKKITRKTAEQIVDVLGKEAVTKILGDPGCLNVLEFLSQEQKESLRDFADQTAKTNKSTLELIKMGLTQDKIELLQENYYDVMQVLRRNCFEPYYKIHGFGYTSSLKVAEALHYAGNDQRRRVAGVYESLRQGIYSSGSTYLEKKILYANNPFLASELIDQCLQELNNMGLIQIEQDKVYPKTFYDEELDIARRLTIRLRRQNPRTGFSVNRLAEAIALVEMDENIKYDAEQIEAIKTFFNHPLSILNGGPGTGKSTIVNGIVRVLEILWPTAKIALCAPTGRAAKRLEQITGLEAKTIHSLLRWNIKNNSFNLDPEHPLDYDFMIVDETSMVDTHLFASLLKALPSKCTLFLIGDENQLESVGPGRVFNELIESGIIPMVSLKTIHRNKEGSVLPELAAQINEGKPPVFRDRAKLISISDQKVVLYLRQLFAKEGIGPDIQILAPKYEGDAGIIAVNNLMQSIFNPFSVAKAELKYRNITLRKGDRVLLKKNLAEFGVYNGDIGVIEEIDLKLRVVKVRFDDKKEILVEFRDDIPTYLTHAWCISIHKSQGSEFQKVICIFPEESLNMLSKKLVYTAVSRAKRSLMVIARPSVFERGSKRSVRNPRTCSLKKRIDEFNN